MSVIKPLAALTRADLSIAGGKGANLGALIAAGLPVPPGFCITTDGYRAFVEANALQALIRQVLDSTQMDDPESLEAASEAIQARFAASQIPPALADQIRGAYAALGDSIPVAVRSSATAEDLPDLSFAGQQDTYLNIRGEQAVLDASRRCWGSLWTGRAIGYRARNHIAQDQIALAVVIQQMVASEVSGVLFTANPLTGKRSETVIDATFGLGEALVSGQVEPDHYVVDSVEGRILSKTLGAKAIAIHGKAEGGTVTVEGHAADLQALPDEQILALERLGRQAAIAFGGPQDVEWGWADGSLYIVQSRPITSLYPLPKKFAADRYEVLFSFASWQGMLDPYTPLGQDMFTYFLPNLGRAFGAKVRPGAQRILLVAGERFYVNITLALSNPLSRAIVNVFIQNIDPASASILKDVLDDSRLPVGKLGLRDRLRVMRGLLPVIRSVLYSLLFPTRGRLLLQRKIDEFLQIVRERTAATRSLAELAQAIEAIMPLMPTFGLPYLLAGVIAGQVPLQVLLRRSANLPGGSDLVIEMTRSLPHNVTTEMDLELWRVSQVVRADSHASAHFVEADAATLVAEYQAQTLPPAAQAALAQFIKTYGLRGVGEIDLGRPRWIEQPLHIVQVIKSYLQITDASLSPETIFARGVEKSRQAEAQLVAAFRRTAYGRMKARLVRWVARRVRELGGLRETPKFAIVRMLGQLRMALLDVGQQLVDNGQLESADDLFFLHIEELKVLGNDGSRDWPQLVAERRATYERESRRKRVPRIILSDGTTIYEASSAPVDAQAEVLSGTPVSAGVAEGVVHVVFDPHKTLLSPGEILVCRATDPAWTPLFLAAAGLIMEIGGMVTHGSVVAREYGIPAVVGVNQATEYLKTGQRVRVDGSTGLIVILSDNSGD